MKKQKMTKRIRDPQTVRFKSVRIDGSSPPVQPGDHAETVSRIPGSAPGVGREPEIEDPRRQLEDLRREISGEPAPAEKVEPAPGEGGGQELKLVFPPSVTEKMFAIPFEIFASKDPTRAEIWRLTADEKREGGRLMATVMDRYLPMILGKYPEIFALGLYMITLVGTKATSAKMAKRKSTKPEKHRRTPEPDREPGLEDLGSSGWTMTGSGVRRP
jgi:hypothetical protein